MFADISADMNGYPEMPKCKPTNKPLQCNRIIHISIAKQSNTTNRLMCTLKCVLLIANDYITFASIVQQKLNNFLSINPTFSNACNNHFGHFWYTLAGIFFVMLQLLRRADHWSADNSTIQKLPHMSRDKDIETRQIKRHIRTEKDVFSNQYQILDTEK